MGGAVASKARAKRANVYKEVVLEDVIRKSRGTKAQQMQAAEGLLMMSQQDASEVSRLVDDGGLVSITVLGRTSTDPKCHVIAVKALENVSKTPEFVRFMIQEGTLEIVTMVLGHKTLSNALVALRTLLNMAKPELTRSKICSVDLLKSLERFVNHDELSVQREGFRLLTMFTEDHRTHTTLVELGTIRLLISVVASPMKPRDIKLDCIHCIAELAHSPVAQLQMNKMKVAGLGGQILKPFVVLIDLIETVDGPKLSCEAMRALGGIAETGKFVDQLVADGIIFPLSKMLLGASPEQQFGSLRCLKLVAMKAEYQIDIARQLNLPKLRQLITSGSRRVSEEAMWMVMVLAQNVVNRPRMIDAQFDQLFRTMAENPKLSGPLRESAEELDKRIFRPKMGNVDVKERMLMKARDRFKKGLQERQLHKERRANKHLLVESDSSDDDSGDDHSHHEGDGSSEASLSD